MHFGQYQKTFTALVTGAIGWGAVVISSASDHITASEWLGLAVIVATALGVYAVPNALPRGTVLPPTEGVYMAILIVVLVVLLILVLLKVLL